MSLYKPGDRVVVRTDLELDGVYRMADNAGEWNTVTEEMSTLAGTVVTIKRWWGQYDIEEDGYSWTDGMFVGLESDLYGGEPFEILDLESIF